MSFKCCLVTRTIAGTLDNCFNNFSTLQNTQYLHLLLLLLLLIIIIIIIIITNSETYNQVQSFQINDYANHYEDIEITGYRAIYSKSIAGRGIGRLIRWLGTAGPVDCFNKSVSDCYIRVYRSFKIFIGRYSQLLVGPTLGYAPKTVWNTVNNTHRNLLQVQLIIHFHSRSKPPRNRYQK